MHAPPAWKNPKYLVINTTSIFFNNLIGFKFWLIINVKWWQKLRNLKEGFSNTTCIVMSYLVCSPSWKSQSLCQIFMVIVSQNLKTFHRGGGRSLFAFIARIFLKNLMYNTWLMLLSDAPNWCSWFKDSLNSNKQPDHLLCHFFFRCWYLTEDL